MTIPEGPESPGAPPIAIARRRGSPFASGKGEPSLPAAAPAAYRHDRADADHVGHHRGTAVADEGQGNAYNRGQAHHHHHVDRHVEEDGGRHSRGEQVRKAVLAGGAARGEREAMRPKGSGTCLRPAWLTKRPLSDAGRYGAMTA